jgi:hypothetical protein
MVDVGTASDVMSTFRVDRLVHFNDDLYHDSHHICMMVKYCVELLQTPYWASWLFFLCNVKA